MLPSAVIMIASICSLSANEHPLLTEGTKKQLATLVAKNDYVAVVEINEGTFTGAVMVHNKVKVIANRKGTLRTTHIFSDINPDENALPPAIKPPKTVTHSNSRHLCGHRPRARDHTFLSRHKGSFPGKGRKTQTTL